MDLFHSGVTLVKSTIEGRAALMADNRASMINALVIHDHALRSLLPKYCGYEVSAHSHALIRQVITADLPSSVDQLQGRHCGVARSPLHRLLASCTQISIWKYAQAAA